MNPLKSNSENAVFQNTKCWLSLKSKSIRGVNSTILKLFEAKPSILVKHAYPSFSTKFDIILRKCCKKTFVKVLHIGWRKDANFVFHFFVANFLDHVVVVKTKGSEIFFPLYHWVFDQFSFEYLPKPANQTLRNKN